MNNKQLLVLISNSFTPERLDVNLYPLIKNARSHLYLPHCYGYSGMGYGQPEMVMVGTEDGTRQVMQNN